MNTIIRGTSFLTGAQEESHVKFCHNSGNSGNGFPCAGSLSSFLFGFSTSAGPYDRFLCTSTLVLSLLGVAGCSVGVTVSFDEDAREVGEGEVEELVERSSPCNACLPHLMRRANRPVVSLIRGLRRVSSGKTSVTPNFALYPRCHKHNGAFADFWRLRLDLCIVLQNLPKSLPIRR